MKFKKVYLIIPVLFLISSCAALIVGGAVGVGAVFYEKGQLTSHEGTSYDETLAAVLTAMGQLGYKVEKTEKKCCKGKGYFSNTGRPKNPCNSKVPRSRPY